MGRHSLDVNQSPLWAALPLHHLCAVVVSLAIVWCSEECGCSESLKKKARPPQIHPGCGIPMQDAGNVGRGGCIVSPGGMGRVREPGYFCCWWWLLWSQLDGEALPGEEEE